MSFTRLAGLITNSFTASASLDLVVQKVKNNQPRDVVTNFDNILHDITQEFFSRNMKDVILISEEGDCDTEQIFSDAQSTFCLLDPLDGSNNLTSGFKFYGYMGCLIKAGNIIASLICVPEEQIYLVYEEEKLIWSRGKDNVFNGNTVYYAYPPVLNPANKKLRVEILDVIDEHTAGLYRYGSCCAGLLNTLQGRHLAFVAQSVRLWDVISYLPILLKLGFNIKYKVSKQDITLIVTKHDEILSELSSLFTNHGIILNEFSVTNKMLKEN